MIMPENIRYSLDDILKELGKDLNSRGARDIIVLRAEDKFFVGGGCEYSPMGAEAGRSRQKPAQNVSICLHSPTDWS